MKYLASWNKKKKTPLNQQKQGRMKLVSVISSRPYTFPYYSFILNSVIYNILDCHVCLGICGGR